MSAPSSAVHCSHHGKDRVQLWGRFSLTKGEGRFFRGPFLSRGFH